ncbi:PDZ and LIM domain protein Zasp isoform X9 [Bradysia coprophila]|uniref:PDZ and LIM domain protein Zasp isoform X9 n=1 Tax=Bradysia coprophila TaxID=38358 RepID=UPI00187DBE8F|nr:PDZ and LIM domain protein Zasp isoform X9 [Bradysia coprophila]
MAQLITVRLSRVDAQPWGLRLQGGKDFGTPLVVQKVNIGSIADQAGLIAGDSVIKVNNVDVFSLRHKDAQDIIVRSGNSFEITIQRGGSTWRPSVTPTGAIPSPTPSYGNQINTVTKTSLAHKQQESQHIGCGYNNAARPFQNGSEPVKSIVNKQYNTPVGIYSEESIAETLSAQAEVLAGGVLGVNFKKNEKVYNSAGSEVLKALQESENDPAEPDEFSPSQLRPVTPVTKHVHAPETRPAPPSTGGLPAGQNICAECERLIVGVFVRIKDKNLHVDCFKCATCGTSLKNQGYFNLNNKLYCDVHAKLAAVNNPPPGTEGYKPVPIGPNTKLSASTISAALSAHHGNLPHQNGTSHNNNHDYLLPNHSRTSSAASSFGSSYVSSTDSNKASPSTVSPVHSRQGSQNSTTSNLSLNYRQNADEIDKNVINASYHNNSTLPRYQSVFNAEIKGYYNDNNQKSSILDDINAKEMAIVDGGFNGKTSGHDESIYGTIRNTDEKGKESEDVIYRTMDGGVIRSVHPPGKGKGTKYQLPSNLGSPKPYSYGSGPPPAGPKSPSSYPPPNWSQPKQQAYAPPQQTYAPPQQTYAPPQQTYAPPQQTYAPPQQTYAPPQQTYAPPKPTYAPPQNYSSPASNFNNNNFGSNTLPRSVGQSAPVPPPLPKTSPPQLNTNEPESYKKGHATELLEESVKNLKVSQQEDFRSNAGKIISFMLENRLADNKNGIPKRYDNNGKANNVHPLKKIIDVCDGDPNLSLNNASKPIGYENKPLLSPTLVKASSPDINDNLTDFPLPPPIPPTEDINSINYPPTPPPPSTDELSPPVFDYKYFSATKPTIKSPSRSPIKSPQPLSPNSIENENIQDNVVVRNRDSKSELSTHARDRRSYIERDMLGNENYSNNITSEVETTDLANELKDGKHPVCTCCNTKITRGPFITALGRIWCPDHFVCVSQSCRRPLADIGFVEEKGDLYCEYCFEKYLAPPCDKCGAKIKGDCLNAIGKHYHPECFVCTYCGKLFGNSPFFLEEGQAYCEADWNELFTTKCFACGFPVEAGDRWVEALSHNYHSQCFNCTMCKKNLEGQSFFAKGGRPYCKNHAR